MESWEAKLAKRRVLHVEWSGLIEVMRVNRMWVVGKYREGMRGGKKMRELSKDGVERGGTLKDIR